METIAAEVYFLVGEGVFIFIIIRHAEFKERTGCKLTQV